MIPSDPHMMPAYLENLDSVFDGLREIADGAVKRLVKDGEFEPALRAIGIENAKDSAAPPSFPNQLNQLTDNQYGWLIVMARMGYTSHCKVMAKDMLSKISQSN
jgi:hypothetical protein